MQNFEERKLSKSIIVFGLFQDSGPRNKIHDFSIDYFFSGKKATLELFMEHSKFVVVEKREIEKVD